MLTPQPLPALSADEQAHAARVAARLRERLAAAGGWLPFAEFMQQALYAPGLGYYMAGAARFGAAGDFVTAPELSPLFARCLAVQVAEILAATGGGDIVEYGAGSGRLAQDLLGALAALGARPARYRIVEVSAPLREQQRQRLQARQAARDVPVEWLDGPPAADWQGVALANEVADALPVERFRYRRGGCERLGVIADGGGFGWQARPADDALAGAVEAIARAVPGGLADGYLSELRPALGPWLAAATATLARGVMLVVDYGLPRAQYYHPSRDGGTLCGFFRHRRVEDVLARPGLQDLTAWVDFTALAEAAEPAGLAPGGFATQAHFLAALGIDRVLAEAQQQAGPQQAAALARDAGTLLLPGEMGERFKVMALVRGLAGPWSGFAFRDLSASL